jgi:hypothetical protein
MRSFKYVKGDVDEFGRWMCSLSKAQKEEVRTQLAVWRGRGPVTFHVSAHAEQ